MRHKGNEGSNPLVSQEQARKPGLPLKEGIRKRKLVLIIDDRHNWVTVLTYSLNEVCDVAKGVGPTFSLKDAIAKIDRHNPDIIISDKQFDTRDKEAHLKLLDYAKQKNPKIKVILFSGDIRVADCGSEMHSFDETIDKESPDRLFTAVREI